MACFICPKCKENLIRRDNSLVCANNHCFDFAKSGYVNLLLNNQSSSKRHGDDKLMVKARTDFLSGGYYDPLVQAVADIVSSYTNENAVVLDAGCGECYYTDAIFKKLKMEGKTPTVFGLDISKDAVNVGAKRNKELFLAVAGINDIPVADESLDVIVNIFAPAFCDEFAKKLKANGKFIKVIPLEEHLFELKNAVYDEPYKNVVEPLETDNFILEASKDLEYEIELNSNEDIVNLFMMTPYYYKTSVKDQEKLKELTSLKTTVQFRINTYQKK